MYVAHKSDDLLVLEHQPWVEGALIALLAFIGPFMMFRALPIEGLIPSLLAIFAVDFPLFALFFAYVRRLQLVLDRQSGEIKLHELSIGQDRILKMPLASLVRAERETRMRYMPYLPKHGSFHRAVLIVKDEKELTRYPVTSVFLLGTSARRAARAINAWLGRSLDLKTTVA